MPDPTQYGLLDFGDGRKLERFGDYVIDRPCPAAEGKRRRRVAAWNTADARYERTGSGKGRWSQPNHLPNCWALSVGSLSLELRATATGQVGFFPEQMVNWEWMTAIITRHRPSPKMLNLFAYTGGASLSAAAAGAEVTHVDSAKTAVSWARRNAQLSGLDDAPIRWIVDDAAKFVRREIRRGNQYDILVLDPPSYGHGPKGEPWKIERHLRDLLEDCAQLVRGRQTLILLTCHSPLFDAGSLAKLLDACFPVCQRAAIVADRLWIRAADGRRLDSGAAAKWSHEL